MNSLSERLFSTVKLKCMKQILCYSSFDMYTDEGQILHHLKMKRDTQSMGIHNPTALFLVLHAELVGKRERYRGAGVVRVVGTVVVGTPPGDRVATTDDRAAGELFVAGNGDMVTGLKVKKSDGANDAGASVTGATVIGVAVTGASVVGASVMGASVIGASVLGASVLGASVVGASVVGASVVGASVVGASVVGASVVGASVIGAPVIGASVIGAAVTGASVVGATVVGASVERASVIGAAVTGASVVGTSVLGASVVGVSVVGVSVGGTTVTGASVIGFSIAGTMTTGANVTGAIDRMLVGVDDGVSNGTETEGVVEGATTGMEVLGAVVPGVGRDVSSIGASVSEEAVIGFGDTVRTVATGVLVVIVVGTEEAFKGIMGDRVGTVFTAMAAGAVTTGAVNVLFVTLRFVGTFVDTVPTHPQRFPNRS